VVHLSDSLLAVTETFVEARLHGRDFEPCAITWRYVPDGLPIPCPFIVLDRREPRGPNRRFGRLVRGPFRVAARNGSFLRALIGARPDVVHAHFGTIGAGATPFCAALGLPLVVSFYGVDLALDPSDARLRAAYTRMFRRGAVFSAEGPVLAQRLAALGAPPARIRLLPLSLPAWAMERPPPRLARPPRTLRLLQVARFVEKKGIDLSIAAVARARGRGADVRLTVAGGGPLEAGLKGLAAAQGVEDAVEFIGYVRHDALPSHLAGCDALIQPSRTSPTGDTEGGHPAILLEALAQGVPVLGTRHADIPFVVWDGENGLLSPENDAVALAENVFRLAVEPDLVERLAAGARARVLGRHGPDVLLRLRERIYREAIRYRAAPRALGAWRHLPVRDPFPRERPPS
jgi:glycosyltransferase involved in cell wall biosynthesis